MAKIRKSRNATDRRPLYIGAGGPDPRFDQRNRLSLKVTKTCRKLFFLIFEKNRSKNHRISKIIDFASKINDFLHFSKFGDFSSEFSQKYGKKSKKCFLQVFTTFKLSALRWSNIGSGPPAPRNKGRRSVAFWVFGIFAK